MSCQSFLFDKPNYFTALKVICLLLWFIVWGFADLLHIVCAGISATSEDIPNKIEDLRSECSSDFGGKDSVTSPDGEDSAHGTNTHSNYWLGTYTLCFVQNLRSVHPYIPSECQLMLHTSLSVVKAHKCPGKQMAKSIMLTYQMFKENKSQRNIYA